MQVRARRCGALSVRDFIESSRQMILQIGLKISAGECFDNLTLSLTILWQVQLAEVRSSRSGKFPNPYHRACDLIAKANPSAKEHTVKDSDSYLFC